MKKERLIKVIRLQENLANIRKIAGWTAEDLGEMLGVSKQNISNLENCNIKLSQAQYIAIRHLLDYQTACDHENTTLPLVIHLLIDRIELTGSDYNELKRTIKDIGAAAATMNGKTLKLFADTLLKASYTRASDFTEIEGQLKVTAKSKENTDWTTEIVKKGHPHDEKE